MAAATAVLGAAAISAYAAHRQQKSASKSADKRTSQANKLAEMDYQRQVDFQNRLRDPGSMEGGLFAQAIGPQTSTGSGRFSQSTVEDSTQGLVKTPELLATRTRAAQAAGEVPYSLAGLLQQQFGAIGRQQEQDEATTRNFLAARSGNPADVKMAMLGGPATRNATAARLAALGDINQTAYQRAGAARQEQAGIEQMLADQFRKGTSRTSGTSSSTQTGPGNISAALGLLRPPDQQRFV